MTLSTSGMGAGWAGGWDGLPGPSHPLPSSLTLPALIAIPTHLYLKDTGGLGCMHGRPLANPYPPSLPLSDDVIVMYAEATVVSTV